MTYIGNPARNPSKWRLKFENGQNGPQGDDVTHQLPQFSTDRAENWHT